MSKVPSAEEISTPEAAAEETAAEPTAASPAEPRSSFRSNRVVVGSVRWLKITGIGILAVTGIFAAGFATGWVTSDNVAMSAPNSTFSPTAAPPVPGFGASVLMPDVRGLTPDNAKQVLADADVDLATVELSSRPAAGPSGLVIVQSPAFGAAVPTVVTLVVSEPATVPVAVGERASTVTTALSGLGAQVKRESVYVPGATIGTVTSIEPTSGAALPEIVTLQITAAPSTVAFAELRTSGSCSKSSTERMDGKDWSEPVTCSSSTSGRSSDWTIGGAAIEIQGTLGLQDSADSGASLMVEVLGDGVVLGTYKLVRGTSLDFTLGTAGRTKITVRVTSTSSDNPKLVIGKFNALGSSAPIDALASP